MKKKNIIIILVALLTIIAVYFGYKGFNLYYYDVSNIKSNNYEKNSKGLKIVNTIYIKTEKLDENKYLTFEDMKIINEFENFKKLDSNVSRDSLKYVMDDKKNNIKASFWMGKTDSYINILKADKTLFASEDRRINNTNLTDFLEKNNINNDIELFKYLEKTKSTKNNILTSTKKIKDNYKVHYMTSVIMPQIKNITLIKGDYKGYILNLTSSAKEVSILKNNKRYIFVFLNLDYFTDEYINQLLNKVEIN